MPQLPGIGGLLGDAARLAQLVFRDGVPRHDLLRHLLREAEASLDAFTRSSPLGRPAEHRLAFRELGLAIGLHGLELVRDLVAADPQSTSAVERLLPFQPLAERIESFWSDPASRRSRTWRDHADINEVMLATSLVPEGFLQV